MCEASRTSSTLLTSQSLPVASHLCSARRQALTCTAAGSAGLLQRCSRLQFAPAPGRRRCACLWQRGCLACGGAPAIALPARPCTHVHISARVEVAGLAVLLSSLLTCRPSQRSCCSPQCSCRSQSASGAAAGGGHLSHAGAWPRLQPPAGVVSLLVKPGTQQLTSRGFAQP